MTREIDAASITLCKAICRMRNCRSHRHHSHRHHGLASSGGSMDGCRPKTMLHGVTPPTRVRLLTAKIASPSIESKFAAIPSSSGCPSGAKRA
eukprot:1837367-Pyramimonas_sp.AAC.1